MFDTNAGRFLQRDPVGIATGDVNQYEYVGGRPTFWVDPSGFAAKVPAQDTEPCKGEKQRYPKTATVSSGDYSDKESLNALKFKKVTTTAGTITVEMRPDGTTVVTTSMTVETTYNPPTAADLIKKVAGQYNSKCDCTQSLIMGGHGNKYGYYFGGRRIEAEKGKDPWGPETGYRGNASTTMTEATELTANNAEAFGKALGSQVCFCKECTIYIVACNVGNGDWPQKIADETHCTVKAPKACTWYDPKYTGFPKTWWIKDPKGNEGKGEWKEVTTETGATWIRTYKPK